MYLWNVTVLSLKQYLHSLKCKTNFFSFYLKNSNNHTLPFPSSSGFRVAARSVWKYPLVSSFLKCSRIQQNFGFPNRVGSGPAKRSATSNIRLYWFASVSWIIMSADISKRLRKKLLSTLSRSVEWLTESTRALTSPWSLTSYQFRSFPNPLKWGVGTGWLYLLLHHSYKEINVHISQI